MASQTASDWLLAALAEEGVGYLFGNPGSTELPLIDALPRQDRVRYVLALHESVAMGMADGFAQASGALSAVNVHVQPGLANALSGVLNAARARVPMLVTVGQQATALLPHAPFLGGELVALARPLAKAAWEVATVRELPAAVAEAVRVARTPPRGPVVLSLPLDVQAAAPPAAAHTRVPPPSPVAPSGAAVDAAVSILAAAERPVVLAGDGAADAASHLLAIAERLGAPILSEPFAAGLGVPFAHPLWAGALPGFASEIGARLADHDAVLAVGMPVFRVFGASPGPALSARQALVHIDVDAAEVGRAHAPRVGIVADPGLTLARIRELLTGTAVPGAAARRGAVARAIAAERADTRRRLAAAGAGETITPTALSAAIARSVGARDVIVEEALTSTRALRPLLPTRRRGSWFAHRGSALGWGLPAAVGVKLARPGRRVMCLQGDGGALFGISALWSARRMDAPIAVVVADNGGYEILRAGLEGLTGVADAGWPGLALGGGLDVARIAQGYGASARRVSDASDLPEALSDMWERTRDGPAVLVANVTGRTPPIGYPVG